MVSRARGQVRYSVTTLTFSLCSMAGQGSRTGVGLRLSTHLINTGTSRARTPTPIRLNHTLISTTPWFASMVAWSNLSVGPPSPKTKLTLQRLGQLASILRLLILLKFLVKASRHVYAYGILGTAEQGYIALKNVSMLLCCCSVLRRAWVSGICAWSPGP